MLTSTSGNAQHNGMGELKAAAFAKLADIQVRLTELARIRDGPQTLIEACPGHGALAQCPILNALASDES